MDWALQPPRQPSQFPQVVYTRRQHETDLDATLGKITLIFQRKMRENYDAAAKLIAAALKEKMVSVEERNAKDVVLRRHAEVEARKIATRPEPQGEELKLMWQEKHRQECRRGAKLRKELEAEYAALAVPLKNVTAQMKNGGIIQQDIAHSEKQLVRCKHRLQIILGEIKAKEVEYRKVMNCNFTQESTRTAVGLITEKFTLASERCELMIYELTKRILESDGKMVDWNLLEKPLVTQPAVAVKEKDFVLPSVKPRVIKVKPTPVSADVHQAPSVLGDNDAVEDHEVDDPAMNERPRSATPDDETRGTDDPFMPNPPTTLPPIDHFGTWSNQGGQGADTASSGKPESTDHVPLFNTRQPKAGDKARKKSVFETDERFQIARRKKFASHDNEITFVLETAKLSEAEDEEITGEKLGPARRRPEFTVPPPTLAVIDQKPIHTLKQQEEEIRLLGVHISELKKTLDEVQEIVGEKYIADAQKDHKTIFLGSFVQRRGSAWSTSLVSKAKAAELVLNLQDVLKGAELQNKQLGGEFLSRAMRSKERFATLTKEEVKTSQEIVKTKKRAEETFDVLEDMLCKYFEYRMVEKPKDDDEDTVCPSPKARSKKEIKKPTFMNQLDRGVQVSLDEEDLPKQMRKLFLIASKEVIFKAHINTIRQGVLGLSAAQTRMDAILRCGVCGRGYKTCYMMFPCGHSFCEVCQMASLVDCSTHKCPQCQMMSQEKPVSNTNVNTITAKTSFMQSGFCNMTKAVDNFGLALGSLDRKVVCMEVKLLTEEIWERDKMEQCPQSKKTKKKSIIDASDSKYQ